MHFVTAAGSAGASKNGHLTPARTRLFVGTAMAAPLATAARLMRAEGVSSLVVGLPGELVSVVTERDLCGALADGLDEVDLRAGDFPYKDQWATSARRTRSVALVRAGMLGRAQYAARRMAMSARARRIARAERTAPDPQAPPASSRVTRSCRLAPGMPGAGGGNDLFARLVGQKFSQLIGQTVVIETKPGAGFGLSIVAELAAMYGGSLALGSAPAGGLRAELRLPAA